MNIEMRVMDEKPKKRNGVFVIDGELQINDFMEHLYIPLDWWSLSDYLKQWQEGFNYLEHHDRSCLVVSIHNPHIRPYINWWLLYKVGDKVHIQNQLVIGEIYEKQVGDKPFNLETCYDFIPERGEPYDEDGNKISEWVIDWDSKAV